MFRKHLLLSLLLLAVLIISALISLLSGSFPVKVTDLPGIIQNDPAFATQRDVIFKLRFPRIILGLAVGGALSLCGTMLQGIFRNPLVEPYTLGISGGASLAICLVLILKLTFLPAVLLLPAAGFLGALLIVMLVYLISLKKGKVRVNSLLLTGVMLSFISSSLVMFLMSVAGRDDLHNIIFWIMGWLDTSEMPLVFTMLGASLAGLGFSYLYVLDLNALTLGEEEAFHLGVKIERTKKIIFLTASLLTGLCVAVSGIIGFVGLVIPHFIRIFTGNDHRILLLTSYLGGAIFLINCDTLARVIIAPRQLPVGVITGIIGGLIFIYALARKKRVEI